MSKENPADIGGIVIHDLPPEHPLRQKVDNALDAMREFDQKGKYLTDRRATEYVSHLLGVEYMFAQLSFLSGPPVLLDVGAGKTYGAYGLSELAATYGLDMQATVLTPVEDEKERLSNDKVHVTSIEYLDGFGKESVRGVLSLASITYSAVPELAISRIDQVLVRGGILKAAFAFTETAFSGPGKYIKTKTPFVKVLNELGYDIGEKASEQFDVVLAIKPGEKVLKSAQELLACDANDYLDQIHDLVYKLTRRAPIFRF